MDFDTRAKEIDEYFDFIKAVLSASTELAYSDENGIPNSIIVGADLQKTIKANGFLLIYNLVESTMKNAIEEIITHLTSKSIVFDDLSSRLKIVILKNLKARNPEKIEPSMSRIAHDIIQQTFDKEELFSGNIDARKIRETMQAYGVLSKHKVNGACLLTIKTQRNDLAHGTVSFAECGKNFDIGELMKFKDEAKAYLQETINDIENFLVNDEYIK